MDYRNCTAWISLDADENRVVWWVMIDTLDGEEIERRPFGTAVQAEEFADYVNNQ